MTSIRVLILEDDDDTIDLLRSVLCPTYECLIARNGLEGFQMIETGQPDLVICDIMMPVMDGWAFMDRVRKQSDLENLPVIFLSALSSREHIRRAYEMGAALYLTKPIEPARLRRNIELFVQDHGIAAHPKQHAVDEVQGRHAPLKAAPTQPSRTKLSDTPTQPMRPSPTDLLTAKSSAQVKPRIIVVEDDRDTCNMLNNCLDSDYEVIVAEDGISAIEMAVRYKPDLFIVDGVLPRMTGYQLTLLLKKNREFHNAPIIFISGKATPRDRKYVDRLGVAEFLPKPFTAAQIQEAVQTQVQRPEFSIKINRPTFSQVHLEQFQHIETHRAQSQASLETIESNAVEKALKKRLH